MPKTRNQLDLIALTVGAEHRDEYHLDLLHEKVLA